MLVGAFFTLRNMVFSNGYDYCSGFNPPMLPGGDCGYSGAQVAVGMVVLVIVLALMVYLSLIHI